MAIKRISYKEYIELMEKFSKAEQRVFILSTLVEGVRDIVFRTLTTQKILWPLKSINLSPITRRGYNMVVHKDNIFGLTLFWADKPWGYEELRSVKMLILNNLVAQKHIRKEIINFFFYNLKRGEDGTYTMSVLLQLWHPRHGLIILPIESNFQEETKSFIVRHHLGYTLQDLNKIPEQINFLSRDFYEKWRKYINLVKDRYF